MQKYEENNSINEIRTEDEKIIDLRKSVKSRYIIKEILSFLDEYLKLNIIAYNTQFQRLFNIDVDYYRKVSGKLKVGGINGEGKQYKLDSDILLFEGEYKNGKKNGKGKEYYENGHLKFEGEYLKGKKIYGKGFNEKGDIILNIEKNGKGKEYYSNGAIQFEGEYFNGRKWNGQGYNDEGSLEFKIKYGKGNIKEYNYIGKLEYEGEYLNGKRHGKGKEFERIKFNEDDFINQEKIGIKKKFSYSHGLKRFEGEFKNGKRNGYGKVFNLLSNKLIFEGEFINGERNGYGKEYNNMENLIYEGEYINQIRNGRGKEYYNNGKILFGGDYFEGKKWNGYGYGIDGHLEFELKDGQGNVVEYDYDGNKIFEGEYKNGERNGHGKEYVNSGILSYEGEYENGKRNGIGKEYYCDGEFFEVEFQNGIQVNENVNNDSFCVFTDSESD